MSVHSGAEQNLSSLRGNTFGLMMSRPFQFSHELGQKISAYLLKDLCFIKTYLLFQDHYHNSNVI